MYIFSRSLRLAPGDMRQQMPWAEAITEKVNQISEVPVLLWTTFASPAAETLAWSASVDTLGVLEATFDKLSADDGYLSLSAEGAKHASAAGITDQLVQIIHADTDVDLAHLRYVSAGSATAAAGQMARAAEVGVEIAKRVKAVTGCPSSFGALRTGPTGCFQWATYFDSIEQLEVAMNRLDGDPGFAELVDGDASRVFAPGVGEQTIVRRVI